MLIRKFLSGLLAVLLLISSVPPVYASEAEPTQSAETEAPVPQTLPPETTVPVIPETEPQPPETTEQTVPPLQPTETTEPILPPTQPTETTETTEPTIPEPQPTEPAVPTMPETLPPETTAPVIQESLPEEDLPQLLTETQATEPPQQERIYATIAEAWAMPVGTDNITIRGTVVYIQGAQAVLQDDTGGIRLSFTTTPDVYPGDSLVVTGSRMGGFLVTKYVYEGISTLPVRESTLLEAPENLRVKITGAVLGNGTLCQDDFSMNLIATIPDTLGAGSWVNAYGVILDGRFYADTLEPGAEPVKPAVEPAAGWKLYFGSLHAHTNLSDGLGTVEEAFLHASSVEGLDFFAVTDHSNSFDNAENGAIDVDGSTISAEWAQGKAAAAAVTDHDFVGIFGYEMTWKDQMALGHMNTFNTPGWQTRNQPGFDDLESYYQVLTTVPESISQFNHPSHGYGNFEYFDHHTPEYDQVIHLLEVGWEGSDRAYDLYARALDEGWHVAPSNNQNNHNGSWGDASNARTVIVARELTEQSIYDAIRNHRVYATEDADLGILYTMNGQIMGSILGPADHLCAEVTLEDPTDTAIGKVEVIVDGGKSISEQWVQGSSGTIYFQLLGNYSYYYLRITQPDGDIAVTAPVWVDRYEDIGISGFISSEDKPLEGDRVTLTLTVSNRESVEFQMEQIEFLVNGSMVETVLEPGSLKSMETFTHSFELLCPKPGEIRITATVTGSVAGEERTDTETLILHCQTREVIPQLPISQVRTSPKGSVYRIKGHVTAGNDNPYNTFSDTVYLQDETGGIAVVGNWAQEIKIGDPLLITGVLREKDKNLVLELIEYSKTEDKTYRYVPETISNTLAKNYALRGGQLLQVEGTAVSFTTTADEKGISRFTLQDDRGVFATVVIEQGIRSGAHGTNTLASVVKKGKTIRAMGLLHMDEFGNPVLRVRNCDEVVEVAARRTPTQKADKTNPGTADPLTALWRLLDWFGR